MFEQRNNRPRHHSNNRKANYLMKKGEPYGLINVVIPLETINI